MLLNVFVLAFGLQAAQLLEQFPLHFFDSTVSLRLKLNLEFVPLSNLSNIAQNPTHEYNHKME